MGPSWWRVILLVAVSLIACVGADAGVGDASVFRTFCSLDLDGRYDCLRKAKS